jgi:hypothetical protein
MIAALCLLWTMDWTKETEVWRAGQEARLRREDGWLSVAGLIWLKPGDNVLGTGEASDVRLPRGPERLGVLRREGDSVRYHGEMVEVNGNETTDIVLRSDAQGTPDKLEAHGWRIAMIKRADRMGVRLWDPENPRRKGFTGRKWFALDPAYRVEARFEPYTPPKTVDITNILGDVEPTPIVGSLQFTLQGRRLSLDAQKSGDGLFIVFKDPTAGMETYGAGRFLYTDAPKEGRVVLDFNRAVNPPCAFTDFATCPLPPRQNQLALVIPAGERAP